MIPIDIMLSCCLGTSRCCISRFGRMCVLIAIATTGLFAFEQAAAREAGSASTPGVRTETSSALEVADTLMSLDEPDRAAGEYLRAFVMAGDSESIDARRAARGVSLAYLRAERPDQALHWMHSIERATADSCLISALSVPTATAALRLRQPVEAERWLGFVSCESRADDQDARQFLRGIAEIQRGDWPQASIEFARVSVASPLSREAGVYRSLALEGRGLRARSPALAGWLGIVPGVGYLYCGLRQTSFAALLVTGIFAEAAREAFKADQPTLGTFLTAFDASWYSGSIYGAFQSASRLNGLERVEFEKRFKF